MWARNEGGLQGIFSLLSHVFKILFQFDKDTFVRKVAPKQCKVLIAADLCKTRELGLTFILLEGEGTESISCLCLQYM